MTLRTPFYHRSDDKEFIEKLLFFKKKEYLCNPFLGKIYIKH